MTATKDGVALQAALDGDLCVAHDPVARVLQALHACRTPGWMFAGHFLELVCTELSPQGAVMEMGIGPHCQSAQGPVSDVAVSVLADVVQAAAVRSAFGRSVRVATLTLRLSLGQLPTRGRLRAVARMQPMPLQGEIHTAVTTVQIVDSDGVLCATGEASFAVLFNSTGVADHPLAQRSTLEGLAPLSPQALDAREQCVWQAAVQAAQAGQTGGFAERLWGITPQAGEVPGSAHCRVPAGQQVGNRVGHFQGGVLLGIAQHTASAGLGDAWLLRDMSAQFVEAGSGSYVQAQAKPVRVGRNAAFVECTLLGPKGEVVLSAQANFVRRAQAMSAA